jgi:hypothetical protein
MWMGKPGFVRGPAHYGLSLEEYQRHENAQRDKSWSAQGIATDDRAGPGLRLRPARRRVAAADAGLGLRRKESVQCRPFEHVMPFTETGLAVEQQQADRYVWVKGKGGRVRWVPLASPVQQAALELAQQVVTSRDAHMGAPDRDLKRNLRRFDYVLEKFGITLRERGATGHGLRHERLNDAYEASRGCPRPCAAVVRCRGRSWTSVPSCRSRRRTGRVSPLQGTAFHATLAAPSTHCGSTGQ